LSVAIVPKIRGTFLRIGVICSNGEEILRHLDPHSADPGGGFVAFAHYQNQRKPYGGAFGLRNAIARERGIAAYEAWVPLERIRPASIPQAQWEEAFAWPPDDRPPYPSLPHRILRATASYLLLFVIVVALLQFFTPFPVVTWLVALVLHK
jgi:hypothetical protein